MQVSEMPIKYNLGAIYACQYCAVTVFQRQL